MAMPGNLASWPRWVRGNEWPLNLVSSRSFYIEILQDDLPKARDEGQIQVENVLQPLDGRGRLVGQYLDEVRAGLVTGRLHGIIVELLDAVLDLVVDLRARQGAIDTGRGLGGVTAKETYSVAG